MLIGIQVLYFFIFSVASLFRHTPPVRPSAKKSRIAVLVPGYKEDQIIVNSALQNLGQTYPRDYYDLVIIADSFGDSALKALRAMDVKVLEVSFELSTKAKSLNRALEFLSPHPPDLVVILDSDNVIAPNFLEKINAAHQSGLRVIQGHRTAKNQETPFAMLDALNEEISNNIFRKGHRVLGLSSATIGSAMAFEYAYYCHLMRGVLDTAGEDKVIELKILKERHTIHYLEDALVYDEKVSSGGDFSKQRRRWVGVQLDILRKYYADGVRELLLRGNLDYFDKVFQTFLIPKVLLIALMSVLGILGVLGLVNSLWAYLAALYFSALLLAIPRRFYNRKLLRAVLHLPVAVFQMLRSVAGIRRSTATEFEVTRKTQQKVKD